MTLRRQIAHLLIDDVITYARPPAGSRISMDRRREIARESLHLRFNDWLGEAGEKRSLSAIIPADETEDLSTPEEMPRYWQIPSELRPHSVQWNLSLPSHRAQSQVILDALSTFFASCGLKKTGQESHPPRGAFGMHEITPEGAGKPNAMRVFQFWFHEDDVPLI